MKTKKYITFAVILTLLFSGLALTSCKKEKVDETTRLFRPVNIQLTTDENSVTATWSNMQGAIGYKVELYSSKNVEAEDGEKYPVKTLVASDENRQANSWTVTGLDFDASYYFRVKANSPEPEYSSRFTDFYNTRTPKEMMILSKIEVLDADNGIVRFEWSQGFDLQYIMIDGIDGEQRININDADGNITVTGIAAGSYTAQAFNNERGYNKYEFTVPILKEVMPAENTFTGVTFRWANISGLGYIEAVPENDGYPAKRYQIDNLAVNYLIATDLQPLTKYTATIYYSDDTPGNSITFGTKDALPQSTVFVSDITELKAALQSEADGSTIAVNPGTYRFETDDTKELANMVLNKGFRIVGATEEKPVINSKGIQVTLTADTDLMRLEGISWLGAEFDLNVVSNDGTYLFDIQAANAGNIKSLEIVNCDINHVFNSIVRADRSTANGPLNILVDNCKIINNNSKQHMISYPNGTAYKVESIKFTNSTITNVGLKNTSTRLMYLSGNDNMEVTIANNTIVVYSATGGFIQYRNGATGATNGGKLIIRNNIIYNLNKSVSPALYNKSLNMGSGTGAATEDVSNNCVPVEFIKNATSDPVVYDNWAQYSGTLNEDPQFADPGNNDFTVGNFNVSSKGMGDPRWIQP